MWSHQIHIDLIFAIKHTHARFDRTGLHGAYHPTGVTRGLVPRVPIRCAPRHPNRDRRDKPGDDTVSVVRYEREPPWLLISRGRYAGRDIPPATAVREGPPLHREFSRHTPRTPDRPSRPM